MLVCHCNIITDTDIVSAIEELLGEDEWRLIVPVQVYHFMNKRGRCCGCFPNVVDIIVKTTEAWHRRKERPEAEVFDLVARLREEHSRIEAERIAARERLRRAATA